MRPSQADGFIEIARASSESDAVMLAVMLKGIGIPVAGSGLSIQVRPADYARASERLRAARVPVYEPVVELASATDPARVEAWRRELAEAGIESALGSARTAGKQQYTLIVAVPDAPRARAVLQRGGLLLSSELALDAGEREQWGLPATEERTLSPVTAALLVVGAFALLAALVGMLGALVR